MLTDGVLQFETGVEQARTGTVKQASIGQLLVRYGAPIELQLHVGSYVDLSDRRSASVSLSGFEDIGVGVKVPIVGGAADGRLDVTFQGIVAGPWGADGISAADWTRTVNLLADLSLGDMAAVSFNGGVSRNLDTEWSLIVTPAVSLTDGWGIFGGWAGSFTSTVNTHFAEGGVTYLASADVQLDVNGGWRVAGGAGPASARSWFLGAGIAFRTGG